MKWFRLFFPVLGAAWTILPAYASAAATITRGPYLQSLSTNRAVIRWRTDAAVDSTVQFGTQADHLTNVIVAAALTTEHMVLLANLQPNTTYYYAIGAAGGIMAGGTNHFFITAPMQGKPTRIWVVGDTNNRSGDADERRVCNAYFQYANGRYTDLCLMMGDNGGNTGSDAEYQMVFFDILRDLLRQTVVYPCIGNHESMTANAQPYLDNFTLPSGGEAGGVASGTERYYSFNYGNIHFVVLDSVTSDTAASGPMYFWLAQDLAANTNDWLIAYWHYSPYSKGIRDSDAVSGMIAMREHFVPLLEAYGVDLVLGGHSHSYERSYLLDGHYGYSWSLMPQMFKHNGDGRPEGSGAYRKPLAGPQPRQGAVYAVVGSSGQVLYGPLNHPGMFYSSASLGSLVIEVDGCRLDAKFLRDTGAIDDHFTIIKGQFRMVSVAPKNGLLELTWESIAGQNYRIYRKNSLNAPWLPVSSVLLGNNGVGAWYDFLPPSSAAFYQVRQWTP